MANEISAKIRIQLANGQLGLDFNPGLIRINQTTKGVFNVVQAVTTLETTVSLTQIGTPRLVIIRNLDATNYVELGTTSADYPIRLYPSSVPSIFELNTTKTTLYLKANAATCRVQIIALEL